MRTPFLALLAAAMVILPAVASAQTTTERRTFTLNLTGYKSGAFAESTNTTGTTTYRQVQARFRLATADLIKLITAQKGMTNTLRATLTVNGADATYTIVDGKLTNTYAFDSAFSMDNWEDAYAESFSGNYNEALDRGTGSAQSVETWTITIKVGAKTLKLKGRVTGFERWNYNSTTSSEANNQTIRVVGELIEGEEACPVEGTLSASYTRITK